MEFSLTIGGTEVIDDVLIEGAQFVSMAQGEPGSCEFRIKDDRTGKYQAGDFHPGQRIVLRIDGVVSWGGYVTQVIPTYSFPVVNTQDFDPSTIARFWSITGVDYNILFHRRFVFDQDDPLKELPEFPENTQDTDAIEFIRDNWLSLSGDGLDWDLTPVGVLSDEQPFRAAAIAEPWGVVMNRIAQNLGAIYYIDPERTFVYTDDETPSAPKVVSDKPGQHAPGVAVGYREMKHTFDATQLANDAMVWGAGMGSQRMVFARRKDEASIDAFGTWQWAEVRSDNWKESSVALRAGTYVNGSPQNRRGHKDPLERFECVIFEPGFRAGQVVQWESEVFGVAGSIPIRRLTIDFPTHDYARFKLELSYDLDPGLSVADGWDEPFFEDIPVDMGGQRPVAGQTIDEFDREWFPTDEGWAESAWGVASGGRNWKSPGLFGEDAEAIQYVTGVIGVIRDMTSEQGHASALTDSLIEPFAIPISVIARWRVDAVAASGGSIFPKYTFQFMGIAHQEIGDTFQPLVRLNFSPDPDFDTGTDEGYVWKDINGEVGSRYSDWHITRIEIDENGFRHRTWYEDDGEDISFWDETATWTDWLPEGWSIPSDVSVYVRSDTGLNQESTISWQLEMDWIRETGADGSGGGDTGNVPGITPAIDEVPMQWTNGGQWNTQYPYVPGSLEVFIEGKPLRKPQDLQEIDPETGLFQINVPLDLTLTDSIRVRYMVPSGVLSAEDWPVPDAPGWDGSDPRDGGYYTLPENDGSGRVYRPKFVSQLGWGSRLDGKNCVAAAGCMALDRHTLGQKRDTPPALRNATGDSSGGLRLDQIQNAINVRWSEVLVLPGVISYESFRNNINSGRGAIIVGNSAAFVKYGLHARSEFNPNNIWVGPHGIYVNQQRQNGDYYVYDPAFRKNSRYGISPGWYPARAIREYAAGSTGSVDRVYALFTRRTTRS